MPWMGMKMIWLLKVWNNSKSWTYAGFFSEGIDEMSMYADYRSHALLPWDVNQDTNFHQGIRRFLKHARI